MTTDDVSRIKRCMRQLEKATRKLGSQWRVKPFGAVASGFAMRDSDLDVTCFADGKETSYTPIALQELRLDLLPLLVEHPNFEIIDEIWTARVPILRLRFDEHLDVDLSCHNTEPLPNTRLLRAYAEMSPRVRELVIMVKLWAKAEGICGAAQKYLSSYAVTLMVIYYLQVDPEVQLPCLPTARFSGSEEQAVGKRLWSCPLQLHPLLCRFFRFYATEFQWSREVVSIRSGERAGVGHPAYSQLRTNLPCLHIEDPFLLGRNLNCVLGLREECVFYTRICQAAQALQGGGLPTGLQRSAWSPGYVPKVNCEVKCTSQRMVTRLASESTTCDDGDPVGIINSITSNSSAGSGAAGVHARAASHVAGLGPTLEVPALIGGSATTDEEPPSDAATLATISEDPTP